MGVPLRVRVGDEWSKAILSEFVASPQHLHALWALRLLGEIAAHDDRPDVVTAEAHYGDALALASELGMRPLVARCHLGLGTLYAKIDRREQAHAELSAAFESYRAMEMTFWLSQAEAALAQVDG